MSVFNELNSVEYFIIHQLTGINLNQVQHGMVKEEPAPYGDEPKWKYVQPELLPREITDVFIEKELKDALIRLNPAIKQNPERAEEVIHKLRAILIAVGNVGLVRANEEFAKWLRCEISMPIGKDNEHVNIRLIDFDKIDNNSYLLTNQFKIRARETKIPIKAVSRMCGFANKSFFAKEFRKSYGYSPIEYRNQIVHTLESD